MARLYVCTKEHGIKCVKCCNNILKDCSEFKTVGHFNFGLSLSLSESLSETLS